jgi:hypothetical protein
MSNITHAEPGAYSPHSPCDTHTLNSLRAGACKSACKATDGEKRRGRLGAMTAARFLLPGARGGAGQSRLAMRQHRDRCTERRGLYEGVYSRDAVAVAMGVRGMEPSMVASSSLVSTTTPQGILSNSHLFTQRAWASRADQWTTYASGGGCARRDALTWG